MRCPPVTTDKQLLDRGTQQNQDTFSDHQGKECTQDDVSTQSQKACVNYCIDKYSRDGEHANAKYVIENDAAQEESEVGKYLGLMLFIKLCTGKLKRWIPCHRDRFTQPRPHLAAEPDVTSQ